MNLKTKSLAAGLSLAGMLSGCATVAPAELVEARNAYATSSNGLAAKLAPTELHDAQLAIAHADKEFEVYGDWSIGAFIGAGTGGILMQNIGVLGHALILTAVALGLLGLCMVDDHARYRASD